MRRLLAVTLLAAVVSVPVQALAWGASGHRIIGRVAVAALPTEVPAFLRTPQAVDDAGELSREPDRSKGSGRTHDSDRDPGHYLDLATTRRCRAACGSTPFRRRARSTRRPCAPPARTAGRSAICPIRSSTAGSSWPTTSPIGAC